MKWFVLIFAVMSATGASAVSLEELDRTPASKLDIILLNLEIDINERKRDVYSSRDEMMSLGRCVILGCVMEDSNLLRDAKSQVAVMNIDGVITSTMMLTNSDGASLTDKAIIGLCGDIQRVVETSLRDSLGGLGYMDDQSRNDLLKSSKVSVMVVGSSSSDILIYASKDYGKDATIVRQ